MLDTMVCFRSSRPDIKFMMHGKGHRVQSILSRAQLLMRVQDPGSTVKCIGIL